MDAGIELEYTYSFHSKQAQYECVRSKHWAQNTCNQSYSSKSLVVRSTV